VADDLLPGGVPRHLPAGPDGDVAQAADRGRAVADGDVADRRLPRLDAVEPVRRVVLADVEVLAGLGRLEDFGRARLELAAVDVERPLLPLERHALAVLLPAADGRGTLVGVDEVERLGDLVPVLGLVRPRALDGGRARVVLAEGPLDDVQMVGAPIRHLAAG